MRACVHACVRIFSPMKFLKSSLKLCPVLLRLEYSHNLQRSPHHMNPTLKVLSMNCLLESNRTRYCRPIKLRPSLAYHSLVCCYYRPPVRIVWGGDRVVGVGPGWSEALVHNRGKAGCSHTCVQLGWMFQVRLEAQKQTVYFRSKCKDGRICLSHDVISFLFSFYFLYIINDKGRT